MKKIWNNRKYAIYAVILLTLLSFGLVSGVLAKYVVEKNYNVEFESGKFYFTVDLLGDTNELSELTPIYNLYGADTKEINFSVQNYFDALRINENDIKYDIKIEVKKVPDSSYDGVTLLNNDDVEILSEEKILTKNVQSDNDYKLTIESGYENGTQVIITINAKSPYTKTIVLTFNLYTYEYLIGYYINDVSSESSIYAELFVTFNILVDVSVNEIIIDWSKPNKDSNALQIDLSNDIITPIDEGNGYYSKAKINRNINAGEAVTIYFFKTNPLDDYSVSLKSVEFVDGKYIIIFEETK